MSNGLSNLGIALTVVFIISLFALLAQLFYVLRRRRAILLRIPTTTSVQGGGDDSLSKEQLLYMFFFRTSNLSRVEPSNISNGSDPEAEMEVIDMLKLQSMHGPSRVLCSIIEGETEGVEMELADEKSAEKENKMLVVEKDADEDDQCGSSVPIVTPFSTPCGSPLFLTPSASFTEQDFKSLPL